MATAFDLAARLGVAAPVVQAPMAGAAALLAWSSAAIRSSRLTRSAGSAVAGSAAARSR